LPITRKVRCQAEVFWNVEDLISKVELGKLGRVTEGSGWSYDAETVDKLGWT
jgi:hypothetical protein